MLSACASTATTAIFAAVWLAGSCTAIPTAIDQLTSTKNLDRRAGSSELLSYGFYDPRNASGGSWLTYARNSGGLGEPLNAVVSANSDPFILTPEGLTDWFWSVQYSEEFLGQSLGERQAANLGDGNGTINQTAILRYNYGDIYYGTLKESIEGGSHVRYWRQNGTEANSGAWFIAASNEMSAADNHMIVPNGYDLGRDELAGNATTPGGTMSPKTNRTFTAEAEFVPGFLLPNSSEGINHGIPTDGRVVVLTVRVLSNDSAAASRGTSGSVPIIHFVTLQQGLLAGLLGALAIAVLA